PATGPSAQGRRFRHLLEPDWQRHGDPALFVSRLRPCSRQGDERDGRRLPIHLFIRGSATGFWSESGFAENLTFRNNRFTHSVTGANELTDGNGALGAIYVGTVAPVGVRGFQNNLQNRNVTIEGNHID